jgi:hypothetical protein
MIMLFGCTSLKSKHSKKFELINELLKYDTLNYQREDIKLKYFSPDGGYTNRSKKGQKIYNIDINSCYAGKYEIEDYYNLKNHYYNLKVNNGKKSSTEYFVIEIKSTLCKTGYISFKFKKDEDKIYDIGMRPY